MSESEWKGRPRDYRLIREYEHDGDRSKRKLAEPTICPECGAVFQKGRWTWAQKPAGAHESVCPACQRIRDRYPAGYLILRGEFVRGHRAEALQLAHNVEAREKAEHPLKRIMDTQEQNGDVLLTTTDIHLVRTIGEALRHAYHGTLSYRYAEEANVLHVTWER
jgi:NMD protein affecting ribosome stability and mRNA decay